jgi:hypothetical protein
MPPVAAEPGPTSGVEYSAAQKQAQTEVFDAPAKEDKAALAREVLGAQDVDTSPVKPPVEQRRSSAKAISLPQAGRAIAIAIDAGKKYDEKGFRVLQSVLKAHGLESIPHGSDGAAAKQHLTEQLEWGQQYDAFCGALEVWSPKEVSAEDF